MSGTSSSLSPGFADPAHDAQRLFRRVLDAFSHPGRIVSLAGAAVGPGTISRATTAYLLTLADRDTPLWLAPAFDRPEVRDYLRFHAGTPMVVSRSEATFAVLRHEDADPFEGFAVGTDTYPDRSATLVIEVPSLDEGPIRLCRGPGIDGEAHLAVAGLDDGFWRKCAANHALFPCGADLVFTSGSSLLALPRSISVEVSPCMSR
ncbi:MAG: phosphonate C-P lyase system protein PhnH [Reyranella sp.]|jgi:alpha-D-ribose 1-methylphosphonate 5-triphosphate synthase subunit PhnH|uniref:phosphonate C-P lyase system protein PhnH n=1 Tax=Reyranella sp. TaxID=1929291 RepID=UPI0025F45ADD|nr:phosphonate C-P lyase system protein PhnH [Reyranella sp.]MBR2816002.1 phosphonate C-P lyase system protein PhnH [Reyranella sp.]